MKRLLSLLFAASFAFPAFAEVQSYDRPIHDAARAGNGDDVRRLLKADPKQREVRTGQGSTPLHLAATNPDTTAMKALIAAGADVMARDNDGATPLHMAAYSSRAKNVQILLEAGADPFAKTDNGRDPGSMARKVKADEAAGVLSLWVLKGCQAGKPC
ncbi:MAG: ankyrin repeat domain-containing protein [Dechloromonas sp.]|uniref:ankyrin repeat domain-containing protein n=1 Tax=Azonexaceae TaxID=2008795 RepID=UPI001CF805BA|nr:MULTISPECIES: ankyrin repeat domain-containing protein [Azonexaceae]MBT9520140.1 ankyrin repeat domain-containing protein [Dechloromonas sp.]UCV24153.1 ankyrin repeat domain-containing protein [Ferribacterium limneticum]